MSNTYDGYANGAIPLSALAPVGNGQYAIPAAAAAYDALNAAFEKEFGEPLVVTSAYRSLAQQQAIINNPPPGIPLAAPGQSKSGLGIAFDFGSNVGNVNSAQAKWVKANAGKYGFKPSGIANDAFNYDYVGSGAGGIQTASLVTKSAGFDPSTQSNLVQPGGEFTFAWNLFPPIQKRFLYDAGVMGLAVLFVLVGIIMVTKTDAVKLAKTIANTAKNTPVPIPV